MLRRCADPGGVARATRTSRRSFTPATNRSGQLCSDLDLTVVQHAGAGSPAMPMDQPASNAVLITEMALWAQRTFGHLFWPACSSVIPSLRFVPTEQGTMWLQDAAGDARCDGADDEVRGRQPHLRDVRRLIGRRAHAGASEYAKRNCLPRSRTRARTTRRRSISWVPTTSCGGATTRTRRASPRTRSWRSGGRCTAGPRTSCRKILGGPRPGCTGSTLTRWPRSRRRSVRRRRGARAARGHGLRRAGRVRLPTVRGWSGAQASRAGAGADLTGITVSRSR